MSTVFRIKKTKIKLSAFWKIIGMYLAIVCIVVAAIMPIYYKALSISKENYLKESSYTLSRSGMMFENEVTALWQIPQTMLQSQHYINIKLKKETELTDISYYYYLSKTKTFFSMQCGAFDLLDTSFILFTNNNLCMTRDRIFLSIQKCFSEYIQYQEFGSESFTDYLSTMKGQITFIPATGVTVAQKQYQQYLTLIIKPLGESVIYGTLFSQNDILNLFNIANLPEVAFFYIADQQGNVLFNHRFEGKHATVDSSTTYTQNGTDFSIIRYAMPTLSCEAVIGVPNSYFVELMAPMNLLNRNYILLAIAVGLLLSVIFSYLQFRPVRKLMHVSLTRSYGKLTERTNEYNFIREVMDNASADIDQLHDEISDMENTVRANMFIRLLFGTIHLDDELMLAVKQIPILATDCRVILFRIETVEAGQSNINFLFMKVYKLIRDYLSLECLVVRLDTMKLAVLAPSDDSYIQRANDLYQQFKSDIEPMGTIINYSVSDNFIGAADVYKAFRQAQIGLDLTNYRELYNDGALLRESINQELDLNILYKLYDLVFSGEAGQAKDLVSAILDTLFLKDINSTEDVRPTYYMLCFVLETVVRDARLDPDEFIIPQFNELESIPSMFGQLSEAAEKISEVFAKRKNDTGYKFTERLTAFIQNNLQNTSLCTDNIVEHFGVSRSFLYKTMKEATGKSVSEFIEASRLSKAVELLETSQINVMDIAEMCGYNPNTFFKVFKKHFGITPSSYRFMKEKKDGDSE